MAYAMVSGYDFVTVGTRMGHRIIFCIAHQSYRGLIWSQDIVIEEPYTS